MEPLKNGARKKLTINPPWSLIFTMETSILSVTLRKFYVNPDFTSTPATVQLNEVGTAFSPRNFGCQTIQRSRWYCTNCSGPCALALVAPWLWYECSQTNAMSFLQSKRLGCSAGQDTGSPWLTAAWLVPLLLGFPLSGLQPLVFSPSVVSHCFFGQVAIQTWVVFLWWMTWICFFVFFFTLYHGKSPSNYHLGEYFWNFFQASNKQIQDDIP